jgi:hypothetical protein
MKTVKTVYKRLQTETVGALVVGLHNLLLTFIHLHFCPSVSFSFLFSLRNLARISTDSKILTRNNICLLQVSAREGEWIFLFISFIGASIFLGGFFIQAFIVGAGVVRF